MISGLLPLSSLMQQRYAECLHISISMTSAAASRGAWPICSCHLGARQTSGRTAGLHQRPQQLRCEQVLFFDNHQLLACMAHEISLKLSTMAAALTFASNRCPVKMLWSLHSHKMLSILTCSNLLSSHHSPEAIKVLLIQAAGQSPCGSVRCHSDSGPMPPFRPQHCSAGVLK